jgi:cytochrome c oxidase subunit II
MRKILQWILGIALLTAAIFAPRYAEVDQPILNGLFGNQIDPATLHRQGEFVENNLGTERRSDGTFVLRMVAQQYIFVPHCVKIPAGEPVELRLTTADVVHKLTIANTNYALEAVPGAVTEKKLEFPRAGDYAMPCQEFCGPGHYWMRAQIHVVPTEELANLKPNERVNCDAR